MESGGNEGRKSVGKTRHSFAGINGKVGTTNALFAIQIIVIYLSGDGIFTLCVKAITSGYRVTILRSRITLRETKLIPVTMQPEKEWKEMMHQ
jgi:hypothetical protein